jgi:hypothetical protein
MRMARLQTSAALGVDGYSDDLSRVVRILGGLVQFCAPVYSSTRASSYEHSKLTELEDFSFVTIL